MSANTINITPQWIKQEQGGYVAPRTLTSCIQDEDGNSFQEYADKMVIMDEDEIIHPSSDIITSVSNQDIYNIVCDKYDPTKTYNVGDYCINNNIAYKCNATITTAEEFDISKWTNISIAEEIKALNNDLENIIKTESKNITLNGSGEIKQYLKFEIPVDYYLLKISNLTVNDGRGYYTIATQFDIDKRIITVWYYGLTNLSNVLVNCEIFLIHKVHVKNI